MSQENKPAGRQHRTMPLPLPDANALAMSMLHTQSLMLRAIMVQQSEVADFLRRRFEADAALLEHLANTRSFSEMMGLFADFTQRTATDYTDEASKLSDVSARTAADNLDKLQKEARTVARAVQPAATAAAA